MKQRAITYALAILIATGICTAAQAKPLAVPNEEAAETRTIELIHKYELTSDRIECLDFETTNKGKTFEVRVREQHTAQCPGDPMVEPTLFFLQIRKRDGQALMLDYLTGNFIPLRKPKP